MAMLTSSITLARCSSAIAFVVVLLLPNAAQSADAPWQAGAARVNITPEKYMWMAGYRSRTAPASGKLTDLWAKALFLQDAAGHRGLVITLDLVGIDRTLSQKICDRLKEKFGLSRDQIVICTSHTHSGPVVGMNLAPLHYWGLDPQQQKLIDEYADRLVEKVVEVAGESFNTMHPSRLQWGSAYESFAVNRRNNPAGEVPSRRAAGTLVGPVDHDVPVLTVRDAAGTLNAVLFGYACHATTVSFQHWSGDFPGYAQIEIEKSNPGCIAMFWAGCGADQNPLPRSSVELAKEYGAELAEAVGEALAATLPELSATLTTAYREIEAPLSELPDPVELKTKLPPGGETGTVQQRWAKDVLLQIEQHGELKNHYPYPVSVWKIGGEIDFIALGGEVVVDYAVRLKHQRNGRRTWVAAYSHDVMAYIPSLRVLKEGGYEGGGSNVYYGLPALWHANIEETIVNAVETLTPTPR